MAAQDLHTDRLDVSSHFREVCEQSPPAQAILAKTHADRVVIQDFCPLPDSMEWQLGQRYWHERGSKAFLSDATPVPYLVNNDGTLSRNVAALLFANLAERESSGTLPPQILTLELGIGVGLFARYFLDAFQELCLQHGKDYYNRLQYIAGDRSEQMLLDACRNGVFANHPGRYLLRVVDALEPEEKLLRDISLSTQAPRPLCAVFLNYVLDCLPATVIEVANDEVRQLCVRTCLARGTKLEDHTDLTAGQLAQRAGSTDPQDQRDLLNVYGLFASEYDYRPVDLQHVPYGEFAIGFARTNASRVLHNYGAIQSLERLLNLLDEKGFILINDYGPTQVTAADHFEHQRFSNATSIGLNFPLLKAHFGDGQKFQWFEPTGENEHIHSRMLTVGQDSDRDVSTRHDQHPTPQGTGLGPETIACFQERFSKAAFDAVHAPAQQAREFVRTARFEAAASSYRQALERQPSNWALMNEVAMFLTFSLRDAKAGIDMVKVSLALNPTAVQSWTTLGECLFDFGRVEEARQAYLRAERLNTEDVRPRLGLAWVHAQQKDYAAALLKIAESLALDIHGEFRDRLLHKQNEILGRMAQQHQQEYLRMANRVSTSAGKPAGWEPAAGANGKAN